MEQLKPPASPRGKLVGIRSFLSRRERNVQKKRSHIIPFGLTQESSLSSFIGFLFVREDHGRGQTTINQVPNAAQGITLDRIWRITSMNVRAVIASIGVSRDSVPMVGLRIPETSNGHRRSWHDLVAKRDDGRFQNPEQLIRVTVGMTTCAGKGTR